MHERVQLCQDPETEFALLRESFGVSRINHILRVHGPRNLRRETAILQEKRAADIYDEVGAEVSLRGFTEEGSEQATLSAGQS